MKRPTFWAKRGIVSCLLSPLSLLYWWMVCLRTQNHSAERMPVPVLCIGNNSVGGTGKTPMVLACVDMLREAGYIPHVISRGYKGTYEGTLRVDPERHNASQVGDEPLLIAKRGVACWVSKRRVDAALAAVAEGASVIIMDDGMQNPTLKKDVTLMVIDGGYGFGNRQMLPAGPCREPLSTSLLKADMLLVMGEATHLDVSAITALHDMVFYAKLAPQAELPESPLLAFAGIGRPQKFFDSLLGMGASLVGAVSFADHHAYSNAELEALLQQAAQQRAQLITTEKDWLRLPDSWRKQVAYMPVKAELCKSDAVASALLAALKEAI